PPGDHGGVAVAEPGGGPEVAGEDRHAAVRLVALLEERPVGDEDALSPEVGTVGEVPRLELAELLLAHLRGVVRAAEHHQREGVEGIGDVRVAGHGAVSSSAGYRHSGQVPKISRVWLTSANPWSSAI